MKKSVLAIALCSLAALSSQAYAQQTQEGSWLVRVRAVNLDPANKSDPIGGVGAPDRLTINSKVIPELDISYFFTPNWATELVLTYPQKQKVSLDGTQIGHLTPPEVTKQGVEMVALCSRNPTKVDTPKKKEIRDKMFADKFEAKSKAYLAECRRASMIEGLSLWWSSHRSFPWRFCSRSQD